MWTKLLSQGGASPLFSSFSWPAGFYVISAVYPSLSPRVCPPARPRYQLGRSFLRSWENAGSDLSVLPKFPAAFPSVVPGYNVREVRLFLFLFCSGICSLDIPLSVNPSRYFSCKYYIHHVYRDHHCTRLRIYVPRILTDHLGRAQALGHIIDPPPPACTSFQIPCHSDSHLMQYPMSSSNRQCVINFLIRRHVDLPCSSVQFSRDQSLIIVSSFFLHLLRPLSGLSAACIGSDIHAASCTSYCKTVPPPPPVPRVLLTFQLFVLLRLLISSLRRSP